MHKLNIAHRDIKSENVVFSKSTISEDFSKTQFKLIDFGLAKLSVNNESGITQFVGTPFYIAPEIIHK